jgi:hypothetical protein
VSASTLATITTILAATFLLCIPAAYYFGRRSSVDDAVDRQLRREMYRPTCVIHNPALRDQLSQDRYGEARDG